ncbi:tripartite tricarboxylate transporter TctB family protein [Cellulosilyticum sp. I15G10I2]|uniref:tripartite tricarboxylate transporter TctB family protein n=1 Tax=Cellulosilyticum sp. I15G10I2 TaxID=1892843 RepID=UPI00085BDB28|nr:tripartite tricarboxylate transporter TctB family protein [Cellulosilyticum sp. I15G10I2]
MSTQKRQDILFAIITLVVGAFYFIMTAQLPSKGGLVDGRTIPYILGGMMIILGGVQIGLSLKSKNNEDVDSKETIDIKTVLKTAFLIVCYIALFDIIGFLITTFIYLFLQFIILSPAGKKANLIVYLLIAGVFSFFIYTSFRYGLDIMLPQGIITFF